VPVGRLRALARYGLAAKAQTLRRLSPERRVATLLAALWQLVALEGTTALEPAYEVGDSELSCWHFPEGSAEDVWASVQLIALDHGEVQRLLLDDSLWPRSTAQERDEVHLLLMDR
jgi:hypothetical protein